MTLTALDARLMWVEVLLQLASLFVPMRLWPDLLCFFLLLLTIIFCLNGILSLFFFPSLRPVESSPFPVPREHIQQNHDCTSPCVSVLVPARNEEQRLPSCLQSLSKQTVSNIEILVLDDNSEDGTAGIVRDFAKKDSRVQLLVGSTLPQQWVGKNWACHQLAQQARAQVLLFTDADTVHHPQALRLALEFLQKTHADMLSVWPRQVTKTWSEWLVIPLVYLLILVFRPQWLERLRGFSVLGAANGQFILIRRSAYDRIGGHFAVASHLVEDVALSRRVRGMHLLSLNVDGSQVVQCRMYENFPELWEGFTKNLRALFDNNSTAFVLFGIVVFAVSVLPFFLLPLLMVCGQTVAACFCAAQCCLMWGIRTVLAIRFRHPPISVLLHPFGQLLVLIIAVNSWWQLSRGTVSWKGRHYSQGSI